LPRPRFARLDSEKKDAILNAALEAFAAQGYDGASYNHIIERAGISKGAMYYYFDDKEDLFATVVRRELEAIWGTIHDLPDAHTVSEFWDIIGDFMDKFLALATERPLTVGLLRQVLKQKTDGLRTQVVKDIRDMGLAWTSRFLEIGKAVGAVRQDLPEELLLMVINAVDEVGDEYMVNHFEELSSNDFHRWGAIFIDLVRRMVSPRVQYPETTP
jgi:AcrR family transcriptional regulator